MFKKIGALAAKTAVTQYLFDINVAGKEVVLKKYMLTKLIDYSLVKSFDQAVTLKKFDSRGFWVEHESAGVLQLLPQTLQISATRVTMLTDISLVQDKPKSSELTAFAQGSAKALAGCLTMVVTCGFSGRPTTTSGFLEAASSLARIFGVATPDSMIGKDKALSVPLPEDIQGNTAFQSLMASQGGEISCEFLMGDDQVMIRMQSLDSGSLTSLRELFTDKLKNMANDFIKT